MQNNKKKQGTAATKAKNKYRDNNYDRKELILPKGMKAEIQEIISNSSKYDSFNSYVIAAINEKRERENGA